MLTEKEVEDVAPFAGAWIEMHLREHFAEMLAVAPFAGAWIEICKALDRGLERVVAPFAGAWIEIGMVAMYDTHAECRSLRGSVD